MIYIFGDLRRLRSFELVRPSISSPQRLRPYGTIHLSFAPLLPNPSRGRFPSNALPSSLGLSTILKCHQPHLYTQTLDDFFDPTSIPIHLPPHPGSPPIPVFELITLTLASFSVSADSFTSFDSDASRTPAASSDQVEIHISEAFQDIDPPHIEDEFVTSSPVPSSRQGESPSNIPTASFIRPFGYNEREEWDGESFFYTTGGFLGGYGGGDEESRISYLMHPTRFGQDRQRCRNKGADPAPSRIQERDRCFFSRSGPIRNVRFRRIARFLSGCSLRRCPCVPEETELSHARCFSPASAQRRKHPDGTRSTGWLVEVPKVFIRRIQMKCGAAKEMSEQECG